MNERIASHGEPALQTLEIICECGDGDCFEHLTVDLSVYERARSDPAAFLLRPTHIEPAVEDPIEDHGGYLLVRKRGDAAAVAEEHDPRA